MGRLTCELHKPGMTALHRVGLAGLYMTLDAFESDSTAKAELQAAGLRWRLDDRRVELEFAEGKEQTAMDKLLDLGFQIDKQGYFRLPGLERNGKVGVEQLALLHQCLLGTFLQHGQTRSTAGKTSRIIEIDDKKLVLRDFAPIIDYSHRNAARAEADKNGKAKESDLFDRQGRFKKSVKIVGWLYPAAHNAMSVLLNPRWKSPSNWHFPFCLRRSVPSSCVSRRVAERPRPETRWFCPH
jgi:CRISPR-associated protein Cas8a1/Csx13